MHKDYFTCLCLIDHHFFTHSSMNTIQKALSLTFVCVLVAGQLFASTPKEGKAKSTTQESAALIDIKVAGKSRGIVIDLQTQHPIVICRGSRHTCYTISDRESDTIEVVVYNEADQPAEHFLAKSEYEVKHLGTVEGEEEIQYTFYEVE